MQGGVTGTGTRYGIGLGNELELILPLALELPDTVRAEITDVQLSVLFIMTKRMFSTISTKPVFGFTATDLTLGTLMRMTSLLPLAVGSPRFCVRAMRLEFEDGRDRADVGSHVGQQGLSGRSGGGDDSGRTVDRDEDGRAAHVLLVGRSYISKGCRLYAGLKLTLVAINPDPSFKAWTRRI
jgi:hypothetical protein